jgi:hypothetical protein
MAKLFGGPVPDDIYCMIFHLFLFNLIMWQRGFAASLPKEKSNKTH